MNTEKPSEILEKQEYKGMLEKSKTDLKSRMRKRDKFVVTMLVLLCMLLGAAAYFGYRMVGNLTIEIEEIKETQKHQRAHQIETNQLLLSNMDWSTRRQKQTLFMRDMIIAEWKRIGTAERKKRDISLDLSVAYDVADNIMVNAEIYPHLDPLLILAIAWKESAFYKRARSHMNAMGLMQVLPVTARPYFEIFGISFDSRKLYDPATNIKIGTRFLDDVYATYGSIEKALAYYNGGSWGATYYPDSLEKCPEETADYVPKVLEKWKEYQEQYKTFRVDSVMTNLNEK